MAGSIRKVSRKNGEAWEITVRTGELDAKGRYIRKYETVKGSRLQAERRLARLVADVEAGRFSRKGSIKLGDFIESYIKDRKVNLKINTWQGYKQIAENHLIPALGNIKLEKLKPFRIQAYYSEALENGKKNGRGKSLSLTTVAHHHRLLHRMLGQAVKWGYIPLNPCELVDPPRPRIKERAFLTIKEMNRAIEASKGTRYYDFIYLACRTGLRLEELLGLCWGDVDFQNRFLSVNRAVNFVRETNSVIYEEPKSASSRRRIDLDLETSAFLARIKDSVSFALNGVDANTPVFCNADETPWKPGPVSAGVKKVMRAIGRSDASLHSLRHSHASALLSAGVSIKIVSERLGHSTIAITADLYTHVAPGLQAMAIESFAVKMRESKSPLTTNTQRVQYI